MRVIAGRLRSRRLHAPEGPHTRPTHDRVKEALFSILGDVRGGNVLDLYAGTGALGIEALSRGARHACFVERARGALECLQRNLQELALLEQSTIVPRSVEAARSMLTSVGPYDLVFCDPPWSEVERVCTLLGRLRLPEWLDGEGRLVVEHASKLASQPIEGLVIVDRREWGDTAVTLYVAADGGDPG